MLHQFTRAIDDTIGVPAGDGIGILDVAVGCNQRFHLCRAPGNDVPFIVANINARCAIDADSLRCDLQRQRVRLALCQRIAANDNRRTGR